MATSVPEILENQVNRLADGLTEMIRAESDDYGEIWSIRCRISALVAEITRHDPSFRFDRLGVLI